MAKAASKRDVNPPNTAKLTIIAQDPSIRVDGRIVMAEVDVPAEELEPGPCGYRVKVVDFDSSTDTLYALHRYRYEAGRLVDPYKAKKSPKAQKAFEQKLLDSPGFHAQNTYAIVMRTLARFEYALGRRLPWGFGGHQIHVAPHAFADANAFYAEDDRALFFGYFADPRGRPVFTCLSHDIVAHETTHALLDGLRDRFTDPSVAEQAAFHEGFADVVAILSVFSLEEIVMKILDEPALPNGRRLPKGKFIGKGLLTHEALAKSVVLGMAEEMGAGMSGIRGDALRRSAAIRPRRDLLKKRTEEHDLGEVLVAAMLNAFIAMWQQRIERLATFPRGLLDKRAVVEEGAKVAGHLLTMAIRAIDYTPPTDITFGDFLSALLTADAEMVPDDREHQYRKTLRTQFGRFGIDARGPASLEGACPRVDGTYSYSRTHFDSLVREPDEVFRFVWENRKALNLDPSSYLQVDSVRPCIRVGPDGFVLRETAATYLQMTSLQAGELESRYGIRVPRQIPKRYRIYLIGGGALIFSEYGQLKYHVANRIDDARRQTQKLKFLYESDYFAEGAARKLDFAGLHIRRAISRGA